MCSLSCSNLQQSRIFWHLRCKNWLQKSWFSPIHSTAADFRAMQIGSLTLQSTEQPHACHVDVPLDEPPALWLMIKRSSPKHKRHVKNALKEMKLTEFLMENHFFLDEINEPRPLAHRVDEVEQLWPIHVAAQLGDGELLRTLLRAGADSTQVSWFMKWRIKKTKLDILPTPIGISQPHMSKQVFAITNNRDLIICRSAKNNGMSATWNFSKQ